MRPKKILTILVVSICLLLLTSCSETLSNVVIRYTEPEVLYTSSVEEVIDDYASAIVGLKYQKRLMLNYEDIAEGCAVAYKKDVIGTFGGVSTYRYYALTDYSLLSGNYTNARIQIFYDDQAEYSEATLLGKDEKTNLAVVSFQTTNDIPIVQFPSDSYTLQSGAFVIAIGNPEGQKYYESTTLGIVSSPDRHIAIDSDGDGTNDFFALYIQHDAAISTGSNGGGLLDINGNFLGLTTSNIETTDIDEHIENISFAIPYNIIATLIPYLENGLPIVRPRLGVSAIALRDLTTAMIEYYGYYAKPDIFADGIEYGIYITSISLGSSAGLSSLKVGDIILTFDGIPITRTYIVSTMLSAMVDYHVGDEVEITYYCQTTKQIETTTLILNSVS